MIRNFKAISPVVATALLLVVAVTAVVGFQTFFQTYSTSLFSKVEVQTNNAVDGNLAIETLIGNTLYVKNGVIDNLSIKLLKIGDVNCNITQNLSLGINEIDVSLCLANLTINTPNIVLVTDTKILDKKVFLKDITPIVVVSYSSCTLDSITVNHLQNYTFYNSTLVSYGDVCSSEVRVCSNGIYGGNSSYQYASCSVTGQDITPDAFSFTNQTGVNLSSIIISNTLIPTGYDGNVSVGITGNGTPQLSVNGGVFTTSTTITFGQNLTLRLNSSSVNLTTSIVNLTFGNYSVLWSVKTRDYSNCSAVDGIQLNNTQSAIFYNSSSGFSTCYSQIRTCNDGILNGTISYSKSTCTSYYDLSCNTDLDGDGFINSTCAVYAMTNTTLLGHLDVNDSNATLVPNLNCMFDDYKNSTSCLNHFVVDGCGSGTVQDISTGLCFQRNMSSSGQSNWANAISYCDTLSLGGNTDWRLPTRHELHSIVDISVTTYAVVGGNNNKFQNVGNMFYWTYTSYGPTTTSAFTIVFNNPGNPPGGVNAIDKTTTTHRALCVRP